MNERLMFADFNKEMNQDRKDNSAVDRLNQLKDANIKRQADV